MPGEPDLTCDIGDSVELWGVFLTRNTRGSIEKGSSSLVVESAEGYVNGDSVLVAGAGPLGSELEATVSAIAGTTLTLSKQASETVTRAKVGRLTNPTTGLCRLKRPDGQTVTLSHTNPSVGRLKAVYTPALKGEHKYAFKGTGAAETRGERRFFVREQDVPDP